MSVYLALAKRFSTRAVVPLMNLYPPFLGAGIRVRVLSGGTHGEPLAIESSMRLAPSNRNFVGTHFGGSLYAMCDPFFVLILLGSLGPDFVVWDKAASIRFVKPGRGTVTATFRISPGEVEDVKARALRDGKVEPVFETTVRSASGEVVAEVVKTLYVRHKHAKKPSKSAESA